MFDGITCQTSPGTGCSLLTRTVNCTPDNEGIIRGISPYAVIKYLEHRVWSKTHKRP